MQRSLVQHQIEFTLCVYEAFVKIIEAENYFVSWRIGKQSSQCEKRVQPNEKGKIIFKTELSLKVKMIYDINIETYREKKGFLMSSYLEKGENKLAGVLTVDLSKQLTQQNRQAQILVQDYLLDKSPDKTAAICIGFRWKLLNQNSMINHSILSESISFLNQNRLLLQSRQLQSASKQNQDLQHQNQALKNQINILTTQIQSLLTTKEHLSQQNKFLRSLHVQDHDTSNQYRRGGGLTQQDLQDLKSLDMIRQQCYKLQTVKTQQSQGASYKQQLSAKQTQIQKLLQLFNEQKQKVSSLQYLNNVLLKQQQERESKIVQLSTDLNKMTSLYESTLSSKQAFVSELDKQITIYKQRNQQLQLQITMLIQKYKTLETQFQKYKQQRIVTTKQQQIVNKQQTQSHYSSQIMNIRIIKQRNVMIELISILRCLSVKFSKFKSAILSNFSDMKINKLKQLVSGVNEIERELHYNLEIYLET